MILVSGYFDPLHVGHLELFRLASQLGPLLVVVNNREQALRKKGYEFMPADDRSRIVAAVRDVYRVVVSRSEDDTVCSELDQFRPTMYVNGGDVTSIPGEEQRLCTRLGIKVVFGLGDKVRSSQVIVGSLRLLYPARPL